MYTHLQLFFQYYSKNTSPQPLCSNYIKHMKIQYKKASRRLEQESNANKDENLCSCICLHLNAKHEIYKMEFH